MVREKRHASDAPLVRAREAVPRVVARVGRDEIGEELLEEQHPIDRCVPPVHLVHPPHRVDPVAQRVVDEGLQILIKEPILLQRKPVVRLRQPQHGVVHSQRREARRIRTPHIRHIQPPLELLQRQHLVSVGIEHIVEEVARRFELVPPVSPVPRGPAEREEHLGERLRVRLQRRVRLARLQQGQEYHPHQGCADVPSHAHSAQAAAASAEDGELL
mmetsp:Transcript_24063/g.59367  ORF Transcript_24063/g.59367 Transcript_24063/m.59367 type:complete len:216 (-) Transcript_24063:91-738(-)